VVQHPTPHLATLLPPAPFPSLTMVVAAAQLPSPAWMHACPPQDWPLAPLPESAGLTLERERERERGWYHPSHPPPPPSRLPIPSPSKPLPPAPFPSLTVVVEAHLPSPSWMRWRACLPQDWAPSAREHKPDSRAPDGFGFGPRGPDFQASSIQERRLEPAPSPPISMNCMSPTPSPLYLPFTDGDGCCWVAGRRIGSGSGGWAWTATGGKSPCPLLPCLSCAA
jgi:hypothetical protein